MTAGGERQPGDKVHRNRFKHVVRDRQRLKKTNRRLPAGLDLLTALAREDVLAHVDADAGPPEMTDEEARGFGDAKVAARGTVVEFLQKEGADSREGGNAQCAAGGGADGEAPKEQTIHKIEHSPARRGRRSISCTCSAAQGGGGWRRLGGGGWYVARGGRGGRGGRGHERRCPMHGRPRCPPLSPLPHPSPSPCVSRQAFFIVTQTL